MVLKGHACKELCRDDAPATAGGGELVGSVSSPPLAQCVQRLVGTVMQCVGASALAGGVLTVGDGEEKGGGRGRPCC